MNQSINEYSFNKRHVNTQVNMCIKTSVGYDTVKLYHDTDVDTFTRNVS